MTISDYLDWLKQKEANKNISEICIRQKHRDIAKEISHMIEGR